MARHHHRLHLSQRTLAIAVVVIALKPLPANPPSYHTFYALYGTVQPVVYSSDYLRGERSVLDHLSATVLTSGELG